MEELQEQLAKGKKDREGLEVRISELKSIVKERAEERRRWDRESSEQVTPEDLLDDKNKQ
jgi:hypothetical protein